MSADNVTANAVAKSSSSTETIQDLLAQFAEQLIAKIDQRDVKVSTGVIFSQPCEIGKTYYFRTLTFHLIGRVVSQEGVYLTLEDGYWIGQTDKWEETVNNGSLIEFDSYQPRGVMFINMQHVVDGFEWIHGVPTKKSS